MLIISKTLSLIAVLLLTLVYCLLCLPLIWLNQIRLAKRLLPIWARCVLTLMRIKIQVFNSEQLINRNAIYTANHTSLLDTFIYPAILPFESVYVAKLSLSKLPLLSFIAKHIGFVFLDREKGVNSVKALAAFAQQTDRNTPIFIHPEGTRSYDGDIKPFKGGFHVIYQNTNKMIIPIRSEAGEELWPKDKLMTNPGTISVFVGHPINETEWRESPSRFCKDELKRITESL